MTAATATEERLLRAAERLFAERGVGAVSLRAVMQEAGTNVASVHYHFGSKEALLEAVVRSRIEDVTRSRQAILDVLGERGGAVDAASLALAFVRPVLDVVEAGAADWVRVIGQLLATNDPGLAPISETFFDRNATFVGLMRQLDPTLSAPTIGFRLMQAMTLSIQVLGDLDRVSALMGGGRKPWSADQVVDQLVDVVTAVLAGPPPHQETH